MEMLALALLAQSRCQTGGNAGGLGAFLFGNDVGRGGFAFELGLLALLDGGLAIFYRGTLGLRTDLVFRRLFGRDRCLGLLLRLVGAFFGHGLARQFSLGRRRLDPYRLRLGL